jgi:uncharacterized damage-inducible protein DinB
MIDKELLAQHLEYSLWASSKVLDAARKLPPDVLAQDRSSSFGGILGTLTHIFQADRIWLKRFEGEAYGSLALPGESLTLNDLAEQWPVVLNRFAAWVRAQDSSRLSEMLFWRNLKGEDKTEKIFKILLHVVNHGSYHRGQVITMIRQAGGEAVSTDILYYPGM